MKKYKNGDYIDCKICGNMFEYMEDMVVSEWHHTTSSTTTVLRYIKCPECESLILIDRYMKRLKDKE